MRNIINTGKYKYGLVITGGGSEAVSELLRHGGASTSFVEATIPYNQKALQEFLRLENEPTKCCSEVIAFGMALEQYHRIVDYGFTRYETIGISSTSILVKPGYKGEKREDGTKRKHYAFIGISSLLGTRVIELDLGVSTNYSGVREEEETYLAEAITKALKYEVEQLDRLEANITNGYNSNVPSFTVFDKELTRCIYPGSFNPIHVSHMDIDAHGAKLTNEKTTLEISISNVDKGDISLGELKLRVYNILKTHPNVYNIVVTKAPKFVDKINVLGKDKTYLVGYDTALRIIDSKYYEEEEHRFVLNLIKEKHIKLLVFHREGFDISPLRDILDESCIVPTSVFQDSGMSSTKIREGMKNE